MDFAGTFDSLARVFEEPTSNLTAAAVLVALFALVILIVIVALLLWAAGGPRTARERAAARRRTPESTPPAEGGTVAEPRPGRRRWSVGFGWTIVALVVAAIVSMVWVSGSTLYCADSCHHGERVQGSLAAGSPHTEVACVACHERPSPLAAAGYTPLRAGHALRAVDLGGAVYSLPSPSAACSACHAEGIAETVEYAALGVRMAHDGPLSQGMSCHECHPGVGHAASGRVPMSRCLPCHDDVTASAACETCHIGDPGAAARPLGQAERLFQKVRLPEVEDCGGCHEQASCDRCHGIRMPHTRAFREGGHAAEAGFGLKRACWRCHVEKQDCARCHRDFDAHGDDFASAHTTLPRESTCLGCHKGHTGSFCDRCHP